jgi:hypothetical protein
MRKYQSYLLLLLLSLILSFVTVITALRGRAQNHSTASGRGVVNVNEEPVADYETPEPKDEKTRAKKEAKNGRFPKGRLDEALCSSEVVIYGGAWLDRLPAFPVALSDSIVIGTVKGAQAYLSSDKTGLFSEFSFSVEEVLKNSSRTPLNVGSTIAGEREGGRVRYPSGCTRRYKFHRQSMPRLNRRYLFFLRRTGQGEVPYILTAYELRAGHVFPLDGLAEANSKVGDMLPQFAAYDNAEENGFLNEVRNAIAQQ